jgi:hypothetical protein
MTKGLQATTFLQIQKAHQLQRLILFFKEQAKESHFLASAIGEVKK